MTHSPIQAPRKEKCPVCAGSGKANCLPAFGQFPDCKACNGTGMTTQAPSGGKTKIMKAVLEVEFDLVNMADEETIENDFDGSVLKLMKWLFKEEGMGIFDRKIRLKKIEKVK